MRKTPGYLILTVSESDKETAVTNAVSRPEQCVTGVTETVGDLPLIVFGDVNARAGFENASETISYECKTFDICCC